MSAIFYAGIDTDLIGDLSLTVNETGGGGASAVITLSDRYFHTHDATIAGETWTRLTDSLYTALNASALNATYSVTFDPLTGFFGISASGGGVTAIQIAWGNTTTQEVFGFTGTVSGALLHTSTVRAGWVMIGEEDGVTEWSDLYEVDEDLQNDLIAYDASAIEMLARPGAPLAFDLEVPWEPRSSVWTDHAVAAVPFTWQRWFTEVRKGVPFVAALDPLRADFAAYLRKSRAAFKPKLLGGGYLGHASIQLAGFYAAEAS